MICTMFTFYLRVIVRFFDKNLISDNIFDLKFLVLPTTVFINFILTGLMFK